MKLIITQEQKDLFAAVGIPALRIAKLTGIDKNIVWRCSAGIRELKLHEYLIIKRLLTGDK